MALALVLIFVALPILEIYVIIQVGQAIGAGPTILLLLAGCVLGAYLIRSSGRRAWEALREPPTAGTPPDRRVSDAALVLVGGLLLLIPGFVTDAIGLVFVLPFTRPLTRGLLRWYFARRLRIVSAGAATFSADPRLWPPVHNEVPPAKGDVIEGVVVDDRFEPTTDPPEPGEAGSNPPTDPRR